MSGYVPILVLGAIAFAFAAFSVTISGCTGPKRYNRARLDSYECGIEPTPQPVGGGRFPVKYFITAMLFIVFDIEIMFLFPVRRRLRLAGAVRLAGDDDLHPGHRRRVRLRVASRRTRVGLTWD
jgi:NADH-quinone oxidoreductase subunit A